LLDSEVNILTADKSWFLLKLIVVCPLEREECSSHLQVQLSADALTTKRRQSMTIPLVLYGMGYYCTSSDGRETSAVFQFAKKYWHGSKGKRTENKY
jgi:hypothetical protein